MAGCRGARFLAEEPHDEILEADGTGVSAHAGINLRGADKPVNVKDRVEFRRIEARPILFVHVHRDDTVAILVADVLAKRCI